MESQLALLALINISSICIATFAIKVWLKNKIKSTIEHKYSVKIEEIKTSNSMALESFKKTLSESQNKQLESFKRELSIRDKSAKIAELFAEWYTHPESQKELNKLTIEAFLWLPDEICQNLSKVLAHDPTAPNARNVMLEVRKTLLGDTKLNAHEFVIFNQETSRKTLEKFTGSSDATPSQPI